MTRPRGIRRRLHVGIGLVVFLTLAGTGGAQALWTADAQTTTGSVSSGALGVTATTLTPFSYTSSSLSYVSPVTVTNSSAVSATPMLAFSTSSEAFATGVSADTAASVRAWVRSGASCAPASGTTSNWQAATVASASLAAGASVTYCVQSSISLPQRYQLVGAFADVRVNSSVSLGNWTATQQATPYSRHEIADTITPGTPTLGTPAPTTSAITIAWTAPADAAGLVGYKIYRDGGATAIGTVPAGTLTFTDTGRTAGTSYSYTVRGYVLGTPATPADTALFTTSPSSGALLASTAAAAVTPPTGSFEQIGNGTSCLARSLQFTTPCASTGQGQNNTAWKLASTVVGGVTYYYIDSQGTGGSQNNNDRLTASSNGSLSLSQVANPDTSSSQKWTAVSFAGTPTLFQFKSARTNTCLAKSGSSLVLATCAPNSAAQKFTVN